MNRHLRSGPPTSLLTCLRLGVSIASRAERWMLHTQLVPLELRAQKPRGGDRLPNYICRWVGEFIASLPDVLEPVHGRRGLLSTC